jgi:hypothetical protein
LKIITDREEIEMELKIRAGQASLFQGLESMAEHLDTCELNDQQTEEKYLFDCLMIGPGQARFMDSDLCRIASERFPKPYTILDIFCDADVEFARDLFGACKKSILAILADAYHAKMQCDRCSDRDGFSEFAG